MTKFEIIQYDIDQNEVVRNEKGFCVPVAPGMLITFIFGHELDFAKAKLWATSKAETGLPLPANGHIQTLGVKSLIVSMPHMSFPLNRSLGHSSE